MAPHSSTLAWKSPGTEEPRRLQSMGSLSLGQDWATSLSLFTFMYCRRKWEPTPVFLPGESQWWRSLVGCRLRSRTESDTTERLSSSSTQWRPLDDKTQHHPTTSSTLCKMPHLNNKRNKNTNSNISRQNYYLTQPCPSEEKQTNKQKLSTNLTLSKAYTNNWTNLRRAETKRKKEFNLELEKETSNTIN